MKAVSSGDIFHVYFKAVAEIGENEYRVAIKISFIIFPLDLVRGVIIYSNSQTVILEIARIVQTGIQQKKIDLMAK